MGEDSSSEESKGTSSESSEEDSDESWKLGYMWGPRIVGRNWLYWQPNMVVDKKAAVRTWWRPSVKPSGTLSSQRRRRLPVPGGNLGRLKSSIYINLQCLPIIYNYIIDLL